MDHQLPLMAAIYGRATQVCVWLRDTEQTLGEAMRMMERLLTFEQSIDPQSDSHALNACIQFAENEWFTRREYQHGIIMFA